MRDQQKKIPLYIQIKNKLVTNIKEGVWLPGDSIPSESQLIEKFNVSRTTIRQAIHELVQNGILETSRGAPTKVKDIPQANDGNPGIIHHEIGTDMSVRIIRSEISSHHYKANQHLSLPEAEAIFFMERLRLADGSPIAFQQAFLPTPVGEAIQETASTEFDIFPSLGKQGVYHINIQEQVSACNATQYEADLLGISPGQALVEIERITLGADTQPIEYSRTKYVPEGFNYRIEIGKIFS